MPEEKLIIVIKALKLYIGRKTYFYSFIIMQFTNTYTKKSDDTLTHLLRDGDCKKETMD